MATLSRASTSARPMLAAEVSKENEASVAKIEAEEMYIVVDRLDKKETRGVGSALLYSLQMCWWMRPDDQ